MFADQNGDQTERNRCVAGGKKPNESGLPTPTVTPPLGLGAGRSQVQILSPRFLPFREHKRTRAKTPENAEPRGTLFAPVRGCSWGLGPQRDRRMAVAVRFAVPLEARADPSVIAGLARTER